MGVVLHATVAGERRRFTDVHRGASGDARGSSQNNLAAEFLGDYVYAAATRDLRRGASGTTSATRRTAPPSTSYRQELHDEAVATGQPTAEAEEPRGARARRARTPTPPSRRRSSRCARRTSATRTSSAGPAWRPRNPLPTDGRQNAEGRAPGRAPRMLSPAASACTLTPEQEVGAVLRRAAPDPLEHRRQPQGRAADPAHHGHRLLRPASPWRAPRSTSGRPTRSATTPTRPGREPWARRGCAACSSPTPTAWRSSPRSTPASPSGRAPHIHVKVHVGGTHTSAKYSGGHVSHNGTASSPRRSARRSTGPRPTPKTTCGPTAGATASTPVSTARRRC